MASITEGTTLGRYVIGTRLGSGGAGEVYRARHSLLGTHHALKVLHNSAPESAKRLLHEGRIQAALEHPNLVPVRDVLLDEARPVLVMDLVEGPSLATLLDTMTLERAEAQRLFLGIVRAVAAAHAEGVIHRDLKPSNVLIDPSYDPPEPRVVDFGISRSADADQHTPTDERMGTLSYAAPECLRGQPADARADVFSLGVMLYEMLCGVRPYPEADLYQQMHAMVEGQFTSPTAHCPDLATRWVRAIEICLQPDPSERPAHAGGLLELLGAEATVPDPPPSLRVATLPARADRARPGPFLIGLALGALGVAAVFTLLKPIDSALQVETTLRRSHEVDDPAERLALVRAAAALTEATGAEVGRVADLLAEGAAARVLPGTTPVVTTALTADESKLAVLDVHGAGRLIDLATGVTLQTWTTGLYQPRNLQISNDGAVAVAEPHSVLGRSEDAAMAWSLGDNRPRIVAPNTRKIRLDPSGASAYLLVDGSDTLAVERWDVRSGEVVWRVPVQADTKGLRVDPAGHSLVLWSDRALWEVSTADGTQAEGSVTLPGRGTTLVWWTHPTVKTWTDVAGFGLVVADQTVRQSDAATGTYASVSEDARRVLVGGGRTNLLTLWDHPSGSRLGAWPHVGWHAPRFADDDQLVVSTGPDRTVRLHTASEGQPMLTLSGHHDNITTLEVSASALITGARSGDLRIWALPSEALGLLTRFPLGFWPDAHAYARRGLVFGVRDGVATGWSADAGLTTESSRRELTLLAPSPDGEWLAAADGSAAVWVWPRDGSSPSIQLDTRHSPACIALSTVSDRVLIGATDGWQILRVSTGEVLHSGPERVDPNQCMLSEDGQTALLGGATALVLRWTEGAMTSIPTGSPQDPIAELRLHPSGTLAAIGHHSGAATVWTPERGMQPLPGHPDAVVSISLTQDGQHLATVSRGGVLQTWTADAERTLRAEAPEPLSSVAYLPGGQTVLAGSRSGKLLWWSTRTGALEGARHGHDAAIFQIVADPIRGRVTTVDSTHAIAEWDATRFVEQEGAHASTGRWTNLRVCEGTQRVVPVVPFPEADTVWAPAALCQEGT